MKARKIIADKNYHSCWMSDGVILYKETAMGRVLKFSNLVVSTVELMETFFPATSNDNSQTQDGNSTRQSSTVTDAV